MGATNRSVLLAGSFLVGCLSPSANQRAESSITNGVPDLSDPGVVALARDDQFVCTGTLVAPRIVMTAAHCLEAAPTIVRVGDVALPILHARAHPEFDTGSLSHDVALLLLATPAPPPASPWPLLSQPMDASFIGRPIRLVGFGSGADGDTTFRKRQGTTTIESLDESGFTFGAHPSQTCAGDSGGPAFVTLDGVEWLAGVTSSGDPSCRVFGRDARVDVELPGFVVPFLAAVAARDTPLGEPCFEDANCASGWCRAAEDLPSFRYCSRPCTSSTECAPAMQCDFDFACRRVLPSPGAPGSSCLRDTDCASLRCIVVQENAPRACAVGCSPIDGAGCATGFACRPTADDRLPFACLGQPGGCAIAGAARSPAAWLWVVAALWLLGRRRWAR